VEARGCTLPEGTTEFPARINCHLAATETCIGARFMFVVCEVVRNCEVCQAMLVFLRHSMHKSLANPGLEVRSCGKSILLNPHNNHNKILRHFNIIIIISSSSSSSSMSLQNYNFTCGFVWV
jgi:hypothetical protein